MSLAFSTLALFCLLLPGSIFSRFYFTGPFSKEWFKPSLYELVLAAIIPSIILHGAALSLLQYRGVELMLEPLFLVIIGANAESDLAKIGPWLGTHWQGLLVYNLSLWLVAILSGLLAKTTIRRLKWDRKSFFFRFRNEFYYLVSGEILDFPHVPGEAFDVDFVKVSALVSLGKGCVIYQGILSHYTLSKDEKIDSLYLSQATRAWMDETPSEGMSTPVEPNVTFIVGDWLVLPYAKVENLSLTYYHLNKVRKRKKRARGLVKSIRVRRRWLKIKKLRTRAQSSGQSKPK